MATASEAYVDTSAFIAFVDRSDSFNPLFRRLFSKPPALVTSSLVIGEGHAWFLKRYDRTRAMTFLAMLEEMPFLKALQPRVACEPLFRLDIDQRVCNGYASVARCRGPQ
jgi:predicted nucleic acid-binding protein